MGGLGGLISGAVLLGIAFGLGWIEGEGRELVRLHDEAHRDGRCPVCRSEVR